MTATAFLRNLLAFRLAKANATEKAEIHAVLHGEWDLGKVLALLKGQRP